jgi:hypothetical protein
MDNMITDSGEMGAKTLNPEARCAKWLVGVISSEGDRTTIASTVVNVVMAYI